MNIIISDNTTTPIKGFGSVKFILNFVEYVLLHDVLYVLGLKKNLVSISPLEDKSMKLLAWHVESYMRNAFTLGSRLERLYRDTGRPLLVMVHNKNLQSELWHRRLAHIHHDALPKLENLVSKIPDVQSKHDGLFLRCVSGMKIRETFPSSKNNTKDILHLIHYNICGPIPMHSLGVHLYYITFISQGIHGYNI